MLRLITVAMLAVACGQPSPEQRKDTGPVRILFLGNSYTYQNDLPVIVERLAVAAGRTKVKVDMIASGGVTLQRHWVTEETRRAVREGKWTYVVLQEHSTLGLEHTVNGVPRVTTDEVFHDAVTKWAAEIKQAGATPVLYSTWARRAAPTDQALLDAAYARAGRDTQVKVAPVGAAWATVQRDHPEIELYETDGAHPSPAGSYLAACALFATIFERSPAGLPATLTRGDGKPLIALPAAQATALQAAVP